MLAILLLYPLRHIFHGVDLADTGYNYANFTYVDNMDSMWYYSTYLANIVGNFFSKLPLGDTYVGLNLYTGLTVSLLGCLGFWFSTKILKISKGIAFVGAFLAVCLSWCPTALLYNYLTYILLIGAVVLLYLALEKEGKYTRLYFILAGVCLGLNIFVRFSNLAQAAMILAVWAMAIIRREKFGKVVSQTLVCLAGYLLGIGIGFVVVCLRDNGLDYIHGVVRLLNMPSEASDYTLYSMVYGQVHHYLINIRWFGIVLLFLLAGMILYGLLRGKFEKFASLFFVAELMLMVMLLGKWKMYSNDYSNLHSVFQWASFLLLLTHITGLVVIFGRNFSEKEKLICGLNMLVILLTPLGSNNHLFSAMNIIYIAAPVTIWMLWRFVKWLPKYIIARKLVIPCRPVKFMVIYVLFILMCRSFMLSNTYVFAESTGGNGHTTEIENSDVLERVKTDKDKALSLEELSGFVLEENLKGREVLLYGDVPALSFYLEMPFVLSPWPDLSSYNLTVMTEAMKELWNDMEEKERECPVIILASDVDYAGDDNPKVALIREMIERYKYEIAFENDRFVLFMADK
ncbi:MAG: hypothetical protein IJZ82_06795 [Lachnospiraceae bacterium]|nr:hypothetical protein [Lachnospiraceae bacterium]